MSGAITLYGNNYKVMLSIWYCSSLLSRSSRIAPGIYMYIHGPLHKIHPGLIYLIYSICLFSTYYYSVYLYTAMLAVNNMHKTHSLPESPGPSSPSKR